MGVGIGVGLGGIGWGERGVAQQYAYTTADGSTGEVWGEKGKERVRKEERQRGSEKEREGWR